MRRELKICLVMNCNRLLDDVIAEHLSTRQLILLRFYLYHVCVCICMPSCLGMLIAKRLSARHLILLHCQIAFVCMYLYPVARALTVSGARWCGTGHYSTGVEGHSIVRLDSG